MKRIVLKPLKSRKQLKNIKDVISAGFTDDSEKYFTITFDTKAGTKQDLTISFETRTARVYLSDTYTE
ncbi:MAG: hypothetical protein ACI4GW_08220 [Lachnospiraceae bacterium]